ncbi:MAG: phosphoserine phosphatase SerB, partial [Spirochaetes bacterium]|nr:phosphoserine phosphatase SerB [Spirochaetota bacterium]
ERAMRGEMDFDGALKERVALLKGVPLEALAAIQLNRLTLTQGVREFVTALQQRQTKTYLVSGGFDFFTGAFRRELNLTGDFANTLEILGNRLTGRTLGEIVNRERKAAILLSLAHEHSVPREEILAVGDGANDIDMVRAAGIGVAFCAKPALVAEASVAIFERDMRLVLPLIQA